MFKESFSKFQGNKIAPYLNNETARVSLSIKLRHNNPADRCARTSTQEFIHKSDDRIVSIPLVNHSPPYHPYFGIISNDQRPITCIALWMVFQNDTAL